jgi:hypothetical protein
VLALLKHAPRWVYAFEALLFGIHSMRLAFLFPSVSNRFSITSRRVIYVLAGCTAIVTTLMFSAESTEGAVLLLPNLMLEMLALQWFGLLFQDYCIVMLTAFTGGIVLEVIGGPEIDGYGTLSCDIDGAVEENEPDSLSTRWVCVCVCVCV